MPFPRQSLQLVGNLGKPAEMRYTPSGAAVTAFSMACTREYEQNGQTVKETVWINVTCWNKLAEQTAQLAKGQQVLVIGRLTPDKATGGPRIWTRQDGSSGASYEVTAQEVWLSVYSGNGGSANEPQYTNEGSQLPSEDDIPF
ncbi:MAG: single-stranded DNA-binding protein [Anaerolineales bacterium]|nr:single-stranded DNA-binding protein [Anaerolineales bacterium]